MTYESESLVAKYLVQKTEEHGGVARKVSYENRKGAPDWFLFFPRGLLIMVETKSTTGKLSALQVQEARTLGDLGHVVRTVSSCATIDVLFSEFFPEGVTSLYA